MIKTGMKIRTGTAIVIAVMVFCAVKGRAGESTKAPEKPVSVENPKFDIPITDPDVRWSVKAVPDCGSGAVGILDGPRLEIMSGWAIGARRCISGPYSGPYGFLSYSKDLDRIHLVVGGARGYLDGPFSRARFGGHNYGGHRYLTHGSRYVYLSEPANRRILRRLDFEKQEVTSVPFPAGQKGIAGMFCDSTDKLYLMPQSGNDIYILSPDGKVEKKTFEMKDGHGGFTGLNTAFDEKHGRIYCSGYGQKKWYVYYLDLNDGSFHGVLPIPQKGEPRRKKNEAGPFKGTLLYNQIRCAFRSDDLEKRFLYIYPNDTHTFFRLDLEKKEVWSFSFEKDSLRFISSGVPRNAPSGGRAHIGVDGDILTGVPFWDMPQMFRYRRIK